MGDICCDDREYVELYHYWKQRIKKHKEYNRKEENDSDSSRGNIVRDEQSQSNRNEILLETVVVRKKT